MILLYLSMAFESMYYPQSIFYEHLHDIALHRYEGSRLCAGMHSHYGLAGVHTYSLTIGHCSYLISGISFGHEMYRENQVVGSFGFDLVPHFHTGVGVALLNYWVKEYCSRYGYALHMSTYYDMYPLTLGGWLNNVNMPHLHDVDAIPMTYTVRIQYVLPRGITCILAARGTPTQVPFLHAGFSWEVHTYAVIGIGANTEPLYVEYMLRLPLGHIGIHYYGTLHEYLGLSHAVRISFKL